MFKLFRISGHSLFPLYKDKERVFCIKIFPFNPIKKNDIVVFSKKSYGRMIKKVTDIKNNQYFVEGRDAMSIDSRVFGLIDLDEIAYKVLFKF